MPDEIDDAALQALKRSFRGALIRAGDPGFDLARRVWNGMIDRHPALIARCTGTADVMAAVDFARERDLLLAVRGGGHSFAGYGTCDGGMVIDLSPMRRVRIDPVAQIARVQGGCVLGDLDHEAQAFGLATPAGVVSDTGVAGLTLGGGIGWLSGKYGWTVDNLLSVDMVTAEGQFITAGASEHEELFWGIRGGGGNFGIVTEFEFRLHRVGPVLCGAVLHPLERGRDPLRFYRDFMASAPDEFTAFTGVQAPAPAPMIPAQFHGVPAVTTAFCWCGDRSEGERVVQPLLADGTPAAAFAVPMAYTAWQSFSDAGSPAGDRYYCKAVSLEDLNEDAIEVLCSFGARIPNPRIRLEVGAIRGAGVRVPEDAMALSQRAASYLVNIVCSWSNPADDDVNIGFAREVYAALRPFAAGDGVYINFLHDDERGRIRKAYGEAKYARLRALKRSYDPGNLFRVNANIDPE